MLLTQKSDKTREGAAHDHIVIFGLVVVRQSRVQHERIIPLLLSQTIISGNPPAAFSSRTIHIPLSVSSDSPLDLTLWQDGAGKSTNSKG